MNYKPNYFYFMPNNEAFEKMILDNFPLIDIEQINKVHNDQSMNMSTTDDPKRPRSATSSPVIKNNRSKLQRTEAFNIDE